jgi:uncharacterized damage-inducible protein DinB
MKEPRRAFLLEVPSEPLSAGIAFVRHARFRMRDDYLQKIGRAIGGLSDEEIWARLNEESNSIGNLILHVAGNMRQWLVSGVGGAQDARVRSAEFAARESISGSDLMTLLKDTLDETDGVLAGLIDVLETTGTDEALQRTIAPQGYDQTVLDAVFHVVEHFSQHTGQILMLAKWQMGRGLALYETKELEKK